MNNKEKLMLGSAVVVTAAAGAIALSKNSEANTSNAALREFQSRASQVSTETPIPTEIPTEIVIPTETQVPTNIPVDTATPAPTETLAVNQERKDVMGNNEITNWDAEISIKEGMTLPESQAWDTKMDDLFNRGVIKEGDIRTYDKKRELKSSGKYFQFAKADSTFPKAKEVVGEAVNIGQWVFANLGYQTIDDTQAKALGLKIIDMTVNRLADGQTFSTRNTRPSVFKGIKERSKQPEGEVCSMYEPSIQISHEKWQNGILHESNEANWDFSFNISPDGIKSKYPELKTLKIKDAAGITQTLSWRLFDYGSKPNKEAGMIAPVDFEPYVWGSEIKKPCGPAATKKAPVQGAAQPGQPGEQPTPVPTKPTQQWPTPMPTNTHAPIPTNDKPAPTGAPTNYLPD